MVKPNPHRTDPCENRTGFLHAHTKTEAHRAHGRVQHGHKRDTPCAADGEEASRVGWGEMWPDKEMGSLICLGVFPKHSKPSAGSIQNDFRWYAIDICL